VCSLRECANAAIQTKLLRSEIDNNSHCYQVGDSEVLDGLSDCCPLHTWDRKSPLIVAVGDWDCAHCGLNWQWAKAVFTVEAFAHPIAVRLIELSVLRPSRNEELSCVNFVEPDLAELSGLWDQPTRYDWCAGLVNWRACSVAERSERIAGGYRSWCGEVADVNFVE
jgi:hypothetical protein